MRVQNFIKIDQRIIDKDAFLYRHIYENIVCTLGPKFWAQEEQCHHLFDNSKTCNH